MITMKGAAVSAKLKEQVEKGLETLTWVPKLTIIRVGENPDDISYEKGATKKLTSFGLEVESKVFPGDISDEAFKKEFAAINADASVDGILMLRPLPKQINEQDIEKMIDPAKDLDGISPVNIAKVFSGDTSGFAPCNGGGSGMHAENERYRAFWQTGGSRRKKHGCGTPAFDAASA